MVKSASYLARKAFAKLKVHLGKNRLAVVQSLRCMLGEGNIYQNNQYFWLEINGRTLDVYKDADTSNYNFYKGPLHPEVDTILNSVFEGDIHRLTYFRKEILLKKADYQDPSAVEYIISLGVEPYQLMNECIFAGSVPSVKYLASLGVTVPINYGFQYSCLNNHPEMQDYLIFNFDVCADKFLAEYDFDSKEEVLEKIRIKKEMALLSVVATPKLNKASKL